MKYVLWNIFLCLMLLACNKVSLEVAASKISIVAPSKMLTGHCTPWQIQLLAGTKVKAAKEDVTLNLALTSGLLPVSGGETFSDASCSTPMTSTIIPKGSSSVTVYAKYNLINSLEFSVASELGSASKSITTTMEFTKLDRFVGGVETYGNAPGIGSDARLYSPEAIATDGTYLYVTSPVARETLRIQ